jgi:ubiquinone/menaquinone biosynthesis C-methylase UbiE
MDVPNFRDASRSAGDTSGSVPRADDVDRLLADKALLGLAGFATGAERYERARPGYPGEAIDHLLQTLAIGPTTRVLDVAAGTGKLTRVLVAAGANVVASDPSAAMRTTFVDVLPGTPVAGATAEHLPFADQSFDAVTVAQAFHWFDARLALAEFARILRPGGGLALVWNERDEFDPVVAELTRLSKWDVHQPYPVGMDFGSVIDACGAFGPVDRTLFRFSQEVDRTTFIEQVESRSYIAVLPDDRRHAILADVAALARGLDEPILLPYIADTFCARVT